MLLWAAFAIPISFAIAIANAFAIAFTDTFARAFASGVFSRICWKKRLQAGGHLRVGQDQPSLFPLRHLALSSGRNQTSSRSYFFFFSYVQSS